MCVCVQCVFMTNVGMPEDGNRGITPSPNNAHVSPKKYAFAHSAWNWGIKGEDLPSDFLLLFFVSRSESSHQFKRVSDVLHKMFRSSSTTKSRNQKSSRLLRRGREAVYFSFQQWFSGYYVSICKINDWNLWSKTTWIISLFLNVDFQSFLIQTMESCHVWTCHSKILLYLSHGENMRWWMWFVSSGGVKLLNHSAHTQNMHRCALPVKYYCNMESRLPSKARGNCSWMTCMSGKVTPPELSDSIHPLPSRSQYSWRRLQESLCNKRDESWTSRRSRNTETNRTTIRTNYTNYKRYGKLYTHHCGGGGTHFKMIWHLFPLT